VDSKEDGSVTFSAVGCEISSSSFLADLHEVSGSSVDLAKQLDYRISHIEDIWSSKSRFIESSRRSLAPVCMDQSHIEEMLSFLCL